MNRGKYINSILLIGASFILANSVMAAPPTQSLPTGSHTDQPNTFTPTQSLPTDSHTDQPNTSLPTSSHTDQPNTFTPTPNSSLPTSSHTDQPNTFTPTPNSSLPTSSYTDQPNTFTPFAPYMTELRNTIQRNWNPPEDIEHSGHALVKFNISRNGSVNYVEILESSGNIFFNESALEAIKKSAPFKPFPANTSRGSLTIKYTFDSSIVDTSNMQKYLENAEKFVHVNNEMALNYINKAIDEVNGDISSYFLYGKRSKIKREMGDIEGANSDFEEAKRLKAKYDKKRIMASKLLAEMEQSPYSYFNLAHSYDIAGDYENAIKAIDKAIELTELNNNYKRYKEELSHRIESE